MTAASPAPRRTVTRRVCGAIGTCVPATSATVHTSWRRAVREVQPEGANTSGAPGRRWPVRDETFEVDDPLHVMRLFGISSHTAMRYITAAHPERTAKLPR